MSDDRELSALYHSADKPQPPAVLNETIRSAAHKAVKPKRSHAPQWLGGIAASLIAALLITQLLPTAEQEAGVSPRLDDAPRPAMDAIAPSRRGLSEDALAPTAPLPAQKKTATERARASKQLEQEKAGMKPAQARKKAFARDEADSALSAVPMAEEVRAPAIPQAVPVSPETELQTIIDLLDAGKTREAKQHLDDFRKRYPGVEIPEALTRRLKSLNAR
jgi:hypothetical protein